MNRGEVRRVLVVCPLSIMQSAWMGDLNRSVIHRSAIIAHHAQASRRIEMIQGDYEIVIINYDGLNLVADEIKADGRFDLVIVDEANAYATATTRRWKSLAKIIQPHTFLWMMTGTPAAQSPLHAYGLAKLVNPSGVPKGTQAGLTRHGVQCTAASNTFHQESMSGPAAGDHADPRSGADAAAGEVLQVN